MAQPVRSEEGRMIRAGFIPDEGNLLVSNDYSQIELRILAVVSEDPVMMEVYHNDLDIHSKTASEIFGIPMDQLHPYEHRRPAKTVNFGIPYGTTAQGLQESLGRDGADLTIWTLDRCEEFIQEWYGVYKCVRSFMSGVHSYARRNGFVRDRWGRIRWIPGINAASRNIHSEAKRQAGNHPIQAGAQGVIKKAMGKLMPQIRDWRKEGITILPLLQIHDDILFEIERKHIPRLIPEIQRIMSTVVDLPIPTPVDSQVGKSWGKLHDWEGDFPEGL
jgi:DNA polymerase-1